MAAAYHQALLILLSRNVAHEGRRTQRGILMISKLVLGGVAAMATVATAGMAVAGTTDNSSAQAGGSTASNAAAAATTTTGVFKCDGGAQKAVYNRIVNQFSTYGEGADFMVPGASLGLLGPRRGTDTLNVTFSAETQLRGSTVNDNFDWAELEVRLDGVPMRPAGPPDSPLAITGSPTYSSNAAQFCGRIGRGFHRIQVVSRVVDNGANDSLTAWIDDYTLRVERAN